LSVLDAVDFNRKRCFKTSLRIHFSDLGGIDHQLRFAVGGGKSEAQAERRLERSRSATPTASRRRKRAASAATKSRSRRARAKCVPRGRKEHGQTECALVGADTIGLVCRTIIGRLFIGRLQRRVGRLSEDSTAGYFGKRHFVDSRRFFVRCLVPFYFYNYFGLELAAASRMPERRRQAQDGSRRNCVSMIRPQRAHVTGLCNVRWSRTLNPATFAF